MTRSPSSLTEAEWKVIDKAISEGAIASDIARMMNIKPATLCCAVARRKERAAIAPMPQRKPQNVGAGIRSSVTSLFRGASGQPTQPGMMRAQEAAETMRLSGASPYEIERALGLVPSNLPCADVYGNDPRGRKRA